MRTVRKAALILVCLVASLPAAPSASAAGSPYLVRDINPGSTTSHLGSLTNVGGTLFLRANDGVSGPELWKSDGTEAGTVQVKDIVPGLGGSYPGTLINVGGTLFFRATDDGITGRELWKSDPNVGVMVLEDPDGEVFAFCSGVLISSTAFLTVPECPGGVEYAQSIGGRAVVSFDPVLDPETSTLRTVEAGYLHPEVNFTNGFNLYGVAILARPVRGITPARLPTLDQLESVKKSQSLTVVGYGVEADCSGSGPCDYWFDGARRWATAQIAAIDPGTIELQINSTATGQGGVCSGDAGAPYFLGNSNVAVAVGDGETGQCHGISWAWRNDIAIARSFLDDFVTIP